MILIALGANLPSKHGEPEETLNAAVEAIRLEGINVDTVSSIWLTAPVPVSEQPWYRNAVIRVRTELSARKLMNVLQKIENDFGRVRTERNAPRLLDLDVLAFNDETHAKDDFKVPHPRMHERAFVLLPLREVAPGWIHPVLGLSVPKMIEALPEGQEIEISKIQAA